jgi:hypothetical protein
MIRRSTMDQLGLFDSRGPSRADEVVKKFVRFHRANPHIWHVFEEIMFRDINHHRHYLSARAVMQEVRHDGHIRTNGNLPFKICDPFIAYYSRMFQAKYPQYAGRFRNRRLTTRDMPADGRAISGPCSRPVGDETELMSMLKGL